MSNSIIDVLSVVSLDRSTLNSQQFDALGLLEHSLVKDETHSSITGQSMLSTIDEEVSDDNDLFQCGKCKKQFSSLNVFVQHKKINCYDKGITTKASTNSTYAIKLQPLKESILKDNCEIDHEKSIQMTQGGCSNGVDNGEIIQIKVKNVSLDIFSKKLPIILPPKDEFIVKSDDVFSAETVSFNLNEQTKYSCEMSHSEPVDPSVVIDDGEFLSLALDSSQVFTIGDNLQIDTGEKILTHENNIGIFETSDELIIPSAGEVDDKDKTTPINEAREDTENLINSNHEFFHGRMAKSSPTKGTNVGKSTTQMKHYCSFCCKIFFKNFDLQQHIRSHTGEKPYQCEVCGRGFAQKSNVKRHLQSHKVWPDDCIEEEDDDDPEGNIKNKIEYEKNIAGIFDQTYECTLCKQSFSNYSDLRMHRTIHRNKKVFKCIQKNCTENFKHLDDFLNHIRSHENGVQYRCLNCTKIFNSLRTLGYHQAEHSICLWTKKAGPRYFRCTKCMNKYASAESLSHHLKTSNHHYPCEHCDKICSSERMLRIHLKQHGQEDLFTCQTCLKDLRTPFALKAHLLIHTGEKPFECHICATAFNRKDKLKRHMLIHEPKKFICPFLKTLGCAKKFCRKDKLRAHMLNHAKGFKPKGSSKSRLLRKNSAKRVVVKNRLENNDLVDDDGDVGSRRSCWVTDELHAEVIVSCDDVQLDEEEDCKDVKILYLPSEEEAPPLVYSEEVKPHQGTGVSYSEESGLKESITLSNTSLDLVSSRELTRLKTLTVKLEIDGSSLFIRDNPQFNFMTS